MISCQAGSQTLIARSVFRAARQYAATAADYPFKPIQYQIGTAAPVAGDDYCLNFRPENARGFRNNALYHLGDPG